MTTDALKELFPREYDAYRFIVEHPLEGLRLRQKFLGDDGFANWLADIFEQDREMEDE